MAELAPPSTATTGTASTQATAKQKPHVVKPEKPDEEQYKKDLATAEKAHSAAQERLNAIKAKLDLAQPANKDSPIAKRQQELRGQLGEIKQKQSSLKGSRTALLDKIRRLEEQQRSRSQEQKAKRGKVPFKSVEDIEREIKRLNDQVESGRMKLVDEKKALQEISNLNKQKKSFAALDDDQKVIDDLRAQITELRKQLDDPESKALSEKFSEIARELDDIKAQQDEVFKNLNTLRDERTKAQAEQREKYAALKEVKDKYYQAKRAHKEYEQEAYRQRRERQRQEREAAEAAKRRAIANQKLDEASGPAYNDEILSAEGLIRYFDPSSLPTKDSTDASKFAATAQRKVDDSGIKGTRLVRKEEDYFIGTGGKKGKKGRKGRGADASPASITAESKFNLSIDIIEQLGRLGLNTPGNQSEVPAVVEKLKDKLDFWKKDQDRKTKENIAKAQKEIDRLEAEARAASEGTVDKATTSSSTQEKNAVASVAGEVKKESIEETAQKAEA